MMGTPCRFAGKSRAGRSGCRRRTGTRVPTGWPSRRPRTGAPGAPRTRARSRCGRCGCGWRRTPAPSSPERQRRPRAEHAQLRLGGLRGQGVGAPRDGAPAPGQRRMLDDGFPVAPRTGAQFLIEGCGERIAVVLLARKYARLQGVPSSRRTETRYRDRSSDASPRPVRAAPPNRRPRCTLLPATLCQGAPGNTRFWMMPWTPQLPSTTCVTPKSVATDISEMASSSPRP